MYTLNALSEKLNYAYVQKKQIILFASLNFHCGFMDKGKI
jgi:hypothetical protein